jgi:hypothetical protein
LRGAFKAGTFENAMATKNFGSRVIRRWMIRREHFRRGMFRREAHPAPDDPARDSSGAWMIRRRTFWRAREIIMRAQNENHVVYAGTKLLYAVLTLKAAAPVRGVR